LAGADQQAAAFPTQAAFDMLQMGIDLFFRDGKQAGEVACFQFLLAQE